VIDGQLVGMIDRSEVLSNRLLKVAVAQAIPAHSTIREAVAKLVENSLNLLVVVSTVENTPIGIVTLHDVLRLHNQLFDEALL
jgi:predicted transcriptional regulator